MTCEDARGQLSAWLDDSLEPDGRAAVAAHLRSCAGCREALERLRATVSLVQSMPEIPVPARVTARAIEIGRAHHAATRKRATARPRFGWLTRPIVAFPLGAAAAAAAVVVAVTVGRPSPDVTVAVAGPPGGAEFDPSATPGQTTAVARRRPTGPAAVPTSLSGRLRTVRTDSAGAVSALAQSLGGSEVARVGGARGPVELVVRVPRIAYPKLIDGLGRLGEWRFTRTAGLLPDPVTIGVTIDTASPTPIR
jgi:hypothetical protein